MNCAVYEERFHTEVENAAAEETEETVGPAVPETPAVPVAEEMKDEEVDDDDDDFDDDDYDDTPQGGRKFGIGEQLKIWWGKAQKKIDAVADETDKMIGNIAN